MPTKSRLSPRRAFGRGFLLAISFSMGAVALCADAGVSAVRLLALGEAEESIGDVDTSDLSAQFARYRERVASEEALADGIRRRAFLDAFGVAPDSEEAPRGFHGGGDALYFEALGAAVDWLAGQPEAYAEVIDRAYRMVIHRGAYEEEFAYWKERPTQGFIVLVGCLEDWARRNQPGLMVTAGAPTISVNCPFLDTIAVEPELASEIRRLADLAVAGEKGCVVLAPAAGEIRSSGGIAFVPVGSAGLREAVESRKE